MKKTCSCGKVISFNATCDCRKEANRLRNKEKDAKNPEEKKFFNSSRWKKLRNKIIERDEAVCMRCYYKYQWLTTSNLEVHHILSRKTHPDLRWNEGNLITLCKSCNTQLGTKNKLDFEMPMPDEYEFHL